MSPSTNGTGGPRAGSTSLPGALRPVLPAPCQGMAHAARRPPVHVRRGRHPRPGGAGPRVLERHPDVVVHLAALAGVRPSIAEPGALRDVNVRRHAARAGRLSRPRRRAVGRSASSSSVYGLDSKPPFSESDPCLRPVSPYAATKRACELIACTGTPSVRAQRHQPALLHGLRAAPAARSGDPQVHAADLVGAAYPAVRRRQRRATTPRSTISSTGAWPRWISRAPPGPAFRTTTWAARSRPRC